MTSCPGRLALCGVPCGCNGENPSHYPPDLVTVPLDVVMAVVRQQMAKWKTTLDWLAEH